MPEALDRHVVDSTDAYELMRSLASEQLDQQYRVSQRNAWPPAHDRMSWWESLPAEDSGDVRAAGSAEIGFLRHVTRKGHGPLRRAKSRQRRSSSEPDVRWWKLRPDESEVFRKERTKATWEKSGKTEAASAIVGPTRLNVSRARLAAARALLEGLLARERWRGGKSGRRQ